VIFDTRIAPKSLDKEHTPYEGSSSGTPRKVVHRPDPLPIQPRANNWRTATHVSAAVRPRKISMVKLSGHSRPRKQAWAITWVTLLTSLVACGSERSSDLVGSSDPPPPPSIPIPPDTLPGDTSSIDTLHSDTLPPSDSTHGTSDRIGVPYGPSELWISDSVPRYGPEPFTASLNWDDPSGIIIRIASARALGHRLILAMTGGRHERYTTDGKFDMAKWTRRMDSFNRPDIIAAVNAGIADGTVLMGDVMDEPNHFSWGGVMTKPLLDEMATYVKRIFPALAVGVSIRWDWRPEERYKVIDYINTQYRFQFGPVDAWRDEVLAVGKQNGVAISFAINPIDGGTRLPGCPWGPTEGDGTYGHNCRMTAAQVLESGSTLGVAGCALLVWKYDPTYMANPDNEAAFRAIGAKLAGRRAPPCRRTN
jgi:hypothetical protein